MKNGWAGLLGVRSALFAKARDTDRRLFFRRALHVERKNREKKRLETLNGTLTVFRRRRMGSTYVV